MVSAFALNPIFIDLLNISPTLPDDITTEIQNNIANFAEETPSYEKVLALKNNILRTIFNLERSKIDTDESFALFRKENAQWLDPYALYCALRIESGNASLPPFSLDLLKTNIDETLFHEWVQFVAAKQLIVARQYAVGHRVALRGDLPVGVSLGSADVWASPGAFKPYEEVSGGRRLGTAAHAWGTASLDWWDARLKHFAQFFHSVRVDEIERFLRVYEAPPNMPLSAGHFSDDRQYSMEELASKKLWDITRYRKPYVRGHLLPALFGDESEFVVAHFMRVRGRSSRDTLLEFQDGVANQKDVNDRLDSLGVEGHRRMVIFDGLSELLNNVVVTEDLSRPGAFYITRELGKSSWNELPEPQRSTFAALIKGQGGSDAEMDPELAIGRLRLLQESTRMEVVGGKMHSDLRNTALVAAFPDDALEHRYNAIADAGSVRSLFGSPSEVEAFWRELGRTDATPQEYTAWVDDVVVRQILWSKAIWAVLELEQAVRTEDGLEEAKAGMPWPWAIEELVSCRSFTERLSRIVADSGRRHGDTHNC